MSPLLLSILLALHLVQFMPNVCSESISSQKVYTKYLGFPWSIIQQVTNKYLKGINKVDQTIHMFKELEKINKVNSAISEQCFKGRLFNVKNVVNLEQRLENSMSLSTLACEMPLSHSSVKTKYTIFPLILFLSEFQIAVHCSLFTKTASYWTLASWVVNMESILQQNCNHKSEISIHTSYWNTLFTSLFNYLWSDDSSLKTTLDTKHTINDNCSSVFKINTLFHIVLSQTSDLHPCTKNSVWHSIRTWKFHSHNRHNPLCTLNPKSPPIQGAYHEGRRKGRQEKGKVPYISTQKKNRQIMSIKVPQAHKSTAWVWGKLNFPINESHSRDVH